MSWRAPSRFHAALAAMVFAVLPAAAQYPGQITKSKDAPEMRAVAVLEWTGDEQHPKASRLIPITVFDGQELQDGGIYLASPEPLALEREVEYQLKQNGKNVGLFVVQNAANAQGSWIGLGTWKPLPHPKTTQAAQSWKDDEDVPSDEPVLHRKAHADDKSGGSSGSSGSGSQGPPPDPDRPTLHRSPDSGSSSGSNSSGSSTSGSSSGDSSSGNTDSSGGSGPAPDPDRPTLHRNSGDTAGNGTSTSGNTAGTDPNRPKLQKKNDADEGSVSSLPDVSDPNRPRLIRGKSTNSGPAALPNVIGLPPDLEQAVAVSDSKDTPEHVWSFSWTNPDDPAKYKGQLEELARSALGLNPPPAPAKPATKKTAATRRTKPAPPPPLPAPLLDEQFRVFELAYGSGATMVMSAHTAGSGVEEKFVTLIAQPDLYGNLVVLVKNVTDAAHLDDTPRMRLVDAVDAMADNRGELLFELRGATQRQFALYRVLRGQATRIFVGGSSGMGVMND